jgi:hypothetical protein
MLNHALSLFNTCANPACNQRWIRSRLMFSGMYIDQQRYCSPDCVLEGLTREFQRLLFRRKTFPRRQHRIPIGLLLMSRGEIDGDTLKAALLEQKRSPAVRLGKILMKMGAVTESQITSAVASQWSVPVFRLNGQSNPVAASLVPFALMERYRMLPVHFIPQRNHLHLAFADSIDRTLIYAIEQMLGVTTESSIAPEGELMHRIGLTATAPRPAEYMLHNVSEAELPGIIRGYALRLGAEQINATLCHDQMWVRAEGRSGITHFLFGVGR